MQDSFATTEDVCTAGCRLFVVLYGGKSHESLQNLRYVKFMEMVSTSSNIDPQKLPPTENAANFHSLRVHLQVMIWKMLNIDELDPKQWGWRQVGSVLAPIMTDMEAGPESLLKFVRCKCKVSSRNPCGNNVCSCRKNGLKCVTACGDCRGENCNNADEVILDGNEDHDNSIECLNA